MWVGVYCLNIGEGWGARRDGVCAQLLMMKGGPGEKEYQLKEFPTRVGSYGGFERIILGKVWFPRLIYCSAWARDSLLVNTNLGGLGALVGIHD